MTSKVTPRRKNDRFASELRLSTPFKESARALMRAVKLGGGKEGSERAHKLSMSIVLIGSLHGKLLKYKQ